MGNDIAKQIVKNCFSNIKNKYVLIICDLEVSEHFKMLEAELKESENRVSFLSVDSKRANWVEWFPQEIEGGEVFLRNKEERIDMTIYGQAFGSVEDSLSSEIFKKLQMLEKARHKVVYYEWPVNQFGNKLKDKVEHLYTRALNADYKKIRYRNTVLQEVLRSGNLFRVVSNIGTNVEFKRATTEIFKEDCLISDSEKVTQLPGGEVYFVPDKDSIRGCLAVKHGNETLKFNIENGEVNFQDLHSEYERVQIAEFGIGTNSNCSHLTRFNMAEKAFGSCHFGFGNNINFGGNIKADYHFDIVIGDFELYIDGKLFELSV